MTTNVQFRGGVTEDTSLWELDSGDTLRVRVERVSYTDMFFDIDMVFSWPPQLPETFSKTVAGYAARVRNATKGDMNVRAVTYTKDTDTVALFDVVRANSYTGPEMTLAELVKRLDDSTDRVEAGRITVVRKLTSAEASNANASLELEKNNANAGNGADGGGSGQTGLPPAIVGQPPSFSEQFGKYAGLVFGLAALVAVAYVVRSVHTD